MFTRVGGCEQTHEQRRNTHTHTQLDRRNSVPVQHRVSCTPVLDPPLPFLPTGKVILSTPTETNAYITTEVQTDCSCYKQPPNPCTLAKPAPGECDCVHSANSSFCHRRAGIKAEAAGSDGLHLNMTPGTVPADNTESGLCVFSLVLYQRDDNGHCCIMQCVCCHRTHRTTSFSLTRTRKYRKTGVWM